MPSILDNGELRNAIDIESNEIGKLGHLVVHFLYVIQTGRLDGLFTHQVTCDFRIVIMLAKLIKVTLVIGKQSTVSLF